MKLLTVTFYKLKMMLSDRALMLAMVLIPALIMLATGYALRYEKLDVIPVAFVDEDGTALSEKLLDRLSGKEGLRIHAADRKTAVEMLKGSKVEGIFIIREGFEERITQGESKEIIDVVKSPSSFSMEFIQEIVAGEAIRFITNNMAARWVSDEYLKLGKTAGEELAREVMAYSDSQWEPSPLMTIRYMELEGKKVVEAPKVSLPAATATSAGIIVVFLMFYILFSSGWLIEERINGTLKRLVSGPGALLLSFSGNVLALMISGILQVALFSSIIALAFGVELFPGGLSYLVFAVYLLAVISISMFLSSVLKTPSQLQTGAPVFALLTGFAGGCFWNFIEMPARLKALSMLTPQGWALQGINMLLADAGSPGGIMAPVLVLLSISLILLPLSYIIINGQITD